LSLELEEKMAKGRKAQLKMMEAEVERLQAASSKGGDMPGIARGHVALKNQLGAYLKDLEADKDGEMVSSDPTGAWYRAAMALMKEIMNKVDPCVRTVADEKEGALGPLRRIMEKLADLNEADAKAEDEPEEAGMKALGQKLSKVTGDLLPLGRALILSQDPSLEAGAHKLVREAEEGEGSPQRNIEATSNISETGSMDLSGWRDVLAAGVAPVSQGNQLAAPLASRRPLTGFEPGNEVTNLI
jgi:hypothetical protein